MVQPSFKSQGPDRPNLAVKLDGLIRRLRDLLHGTGEPGEWAVFCIEIDAEPATKSAIEGLLLDLLAADAGWATSMEDCLARVNGSKFLMLMTRYSLVRAFQTARLLRLKFCRKTESLTGSANLPDPWIGIVPAARGCDLHRLLRLALNACASAKRRGHESICIHGVETSSRTIRFARTDHAVGDSVFDESIEECRLNSCRRLL